MKYGEQEFWYAEPFANALVNDAIFRAWVLRRTIFSNVADGAQLLDKEMKSKRSAVAGNWWRSHYTESCRCFGCRGQETDLLAIFQTAIGKRFALHFEVKRPGDRFNDSGHQAEAYPVRAQCWVSKAPQKILPHSEASTVLLCSSSQLKKFAPHVGFFATVITFEDVRKDFPTLWNFPL